jgi:hypothetical protein
MGTHIAQSPAGDESGDGETANTRAEARSARMSYWGVPAVAGGLAYRETSGTRRGMSYAGYALMLEGRRRGGVRSPTPPRHGSNPLVYS